MPHCKGRGGPTSRRRPRSCRRPNPATATARALDSSTRLFLSLPGVAVLSSGCGPGLWLRQDVILQGKCKGRAGAMSLPAASLDSHRCRATDETQHSLRPSPSHTRPRRAKQQRQPSRRTTEAHLADPTNLPAAASCVPCFSASSCSLLSSLAYRLMRTTRNYTAS